MLAMTAELLVFEQADDSFFLQKKHSPHPKLNPETTLCVDGAEHISL